MPLIKGHSPEVVSSNVKELLRAGHPKSQAVAIALASKRKFKKMAEGGLVSEDFDEAGTPMPVDAGDEAPMMTDKPSAGAQLEYRPDTDETRDIVEINADGYEDPDSISNPMTMALRRMAGGGEVNPKLAMVPKMDRFAMGGLVDEPDMVHEKLGSKPTEDMSDSIEDMAMVPKAVRDGVSEEAMEAIRAKRAKRRMPIV